MKFRLDLNWWIGSKLKPCMYIFQQKELKQNSVLKQRYSNLLYPKLYISFYEASYVNERKERRKEKTEVWKYRKDGDRKRMWTMTLLWFSTKFDFLSLNTPRPTMSVHKKFSPIGPVVWPAIRNIYINTRMSCFILNIIMIYKSVLNLFSQDIIIICTCVFVWKWLVDLYIKEEHEMLNIKWLLTNSV